MSAAARVSDGASTSAVRPGRERQRIARKALLDAAAMLLDKGAQLPVVIERREKIALGQIARGGVAERVKRAVKTGRQGLPQHSGRMIAAHAEQTAEMILVDMRTDREVEPRKRARYSSARMRPLVRSANSLSAALPPSMSA